MVKENKTQTQHILDALMTGRALLLRDIINMVSETSGKKAKRQDTSSIMTRISDCSVFEIGYFITKNKSQRGPYEYSLVPEIMNLKHEEIYGLALKSDENRFTLKMALKKIPKLKKYVRKSRIKKTFLKTAPTQPEPVIQAPTTWDIVAEFLNEIAKVGGLKVNVNCKITVLKAGDAFMSSKSVRRKH
jgi:phage-related protein